MDSDAKASLIVQEKFQAVAATRSGMHAPVDRLGRHAQAVFAMDHPGCQRLCDVENARRGHQALQHVERCLGAGRALGDDVGIQLQVVVQACLLYTSIDGLFDGSGNMTRVTQIASYALIFQPIHQRQRVCPSNFRAQRNERLAHLHHTPICKE